MNLDLDKEDLVCLVRGSSPSYSVFDHQLLKKAGHFYSDQYARTSWNELHTLTEEELYELYILCKNKD